MIKAIINEQGKPLRMQSFRHATVKQLLVGYQEKFGKVQRNTLAVTQEGHEVVRWNFKRASVILHGNGVRTQFGYRTVK